MTVAVDDADEGEVLLCINVTVVRQRYLTLMKTMKLMMKMTTSMVYRSMCQVMKYILSLHQ